MFSGRGKLRPRSDQRAYLFIGSFIGVISGYYIFSDLLNNVVRAKSVAITNSPPTVDTPHSKKWRYQGLGDASRHRNIISNIGKAGDARTSVPQRHQRQCCYDILFCGATRPFTKSFILLLRSHSFCGPCLKSQKKVKTWHLTFNLSKRWHNETYNTWNKIK